MSLRKPSALAQQFCSRSRLCRPKLAPRRGQCTTSGIRSGVHRPCNRFRLIFFVRPSTMLEASILLNTPDSTRQDLFPTFICSGGNFAVPCTADGLAYYASASGAFRTSWTPQAGVGQPATLVRGRGAAANSEGREFRGTGPRTGHARNRNGTGPTLVVPAGGRAALSLFTWRRESSSESLSCPRAAREEASESFLACVACLACLRW